MPTAFCGRNKCLGVIRNYLTRCSSSGHESFKVTDESFAAHNLVQDQGGLLWLNNAYICIPFSFSLGDLMYKGPAKSTPRKENGSFLYTLYSGRGGGIGA